MKIKHLFLSLFLLLTTVPAIHCMDPRDDYDLVLIYFPGARGVVEREIVGNLEGFVRPRGQVRRRDNENLGRQEGDRARKRSRR